MSAPSSVLNSLRHIPTANTFQTEHQIYLVDDERQAEEREDAEREDSEAPSAPPTPGPSQTLPRTSSYLQQSLKRQWTKRKYAKYDRDHYDLEDGPLPPDEDPTIPSQVGEEAAHTQTNYLERGQAKVKSFLKRKGTLGNRKNEQDAVIDILYENQRGVFFFGIPKYSSSSLLPSDPNPWQNAHFKASPVDIRNAQVPDPSWTWAWKSWYVDMSRDVDEEGWEYSFKFYGGFAWHGNHPWFHSFVRRRRWLRMRRRKDVHHYTKEKAHELTAEYFTIHPKTVRPASEDYSRVASTEMARLREKSYEPQDLEKMDISDIASLIQIMKRAAVDREKLLAVRKFVDAGGDELYYLSERMSEIMDLFIFQSSRRQLLTDLLHRFDQVHQRRQSLSDHQHEDEDAQKEHDLATKQAENLMKAVKAADQQVKRLEYWSDIKSMAQDGETLHDTSPDAWDHSKWQGLGLYGSRRASQQVTFASKQPASAGAPELHRHPEHQPEENGDEASMFTAPSKKSSNVGAEVVAVRHGSTKDSSTENEGYVTAAESASEMRDTPNASRNKSKLNTSKLDGVLESEEDADRSSVQEPPPSRRAKQNVQIVEPVPEPSDARQGGEDS